MERIIFFREEAGRMIRRDFLRRYGSGAAAVAGAMAGGLGSPGARAEEGPLDLLIKGGHVIDPANGIDGVMDVGIRGGRIVEVAPEIPENAALEVADAGRFHVTPGIVDIHVHTFYTFITRTVESVLADQTFRTAGTTTVVDAGTSGAQSFPNFKKIIDKSLVRMLAYLNIAAPGMNEAEQDPNTFDIDMAVSRLAEHPDILVGVKSAHYWAGSREYDSLHTPGASVDATLEAAREAGLHAMFDFYPREAQGSWSARTYRDLLLEKMQPTDIHTHCYAAHIPCVDDNGILNDYMLEAQDQGRILDLGHGAGSFIWEHAVPSIEQGYIADSISTDLHGANINGPVHDMSNVMSKFLAMGVPLEDVIRRSTVNPALEIARPDLGSLTPGNPADIAMFEMLTGDFRYADVRKNHIRGDKKLQAVFTLYGGSVLFDKYQIRRGPVRVENGVPEPFEPLAAYPNPFNRGTTVRYWLDDEGPVELAVYNALGQKVRSLVSRVLEPGHYTAFWDARDDDMRPVTSGVYILSLRAGRERMTERVTLMK